MKTETLMQIPESNSKSDRAPLPEPPIKMIAMKLDRNYHPAGSFEVVGHTKPEILRKNAAGVETIVSKEEWVPGEPMPATIAGTGFKDKFWAGTVLRLPIEEAKTVEKARIGVRSIED